MSKLVKFKNVPFATNEDLNRQYQTMPQPRHLNKVKEFQIGNGTKVWRADQNGMWLGAEKFEDAPFRVDMEGNVTGISFDGISVSGITLTGSTITGNTISGGTITGATITGALVRTSAGGDRIEMSTKNELGFPAEGLYMYSGGNIVFTITQNTLSFYDNSGTLKAVIQMPTAGTLGFGGENFDFNPTGLFRINGLPTSDPGVSGALWDDGGTVKVS